MFSSKFEPIIKRHPERALQLRHIAEYFQSAESKKKTIGRMKIAPSRLGQIAHTGNAIELAEVIALLISEKIFERVVYVESPTGGGIAEFKSLGEVPDSILDFKQDLVIPISLDLVKTFYRPVL